MDITNNNNRDSLIIDPLKKNSAKKDLKEKEIKNSKEKQIQKVSTQKIEKQKKQDSAIERKKERISFSKLPFESEYPDLLALQVESFKKLFEIGDTRLQKEPKRLFKIFEELFPISDTRGDLNLTFLGYTILPPCYTPNECLELGTTYDVPLKAHFRLTCKDGGTTRVVEEEVYLLNIPYMTPKGSFIFRGTEITVVSQLERSPGVFFSQTKHTTGVNLYTAKIIPAIGTWNEFFVDMYNVMHAYLDRRKKIPVTLLLRAIGYSSDKEILQLFDLAEEVNVNKVTLQKYKGRTLAGKVLRTWNEEYIDVETDEVVTMPRHEVVLDRNTILNDEAIEKILASGQRKIMLLKADITEHDFFFIYTTLQEDPTNSEKEAIEYIYCQFRNSTPGDEIVTREFVKQILFSPKRSFLGHIGRHSLNKKLGYETPREDFLLTEEDIVATIKVFPDLMKGKRATEDLDSLVNRIVLLSGDLIYLALERGVKAAVHYARETINNLSDDLPTPFDIISGSYITSVLSTFFNIEPNAQYKDQTNALSELEHSRRITKIGKNLTQERAGIDVRDVHPTHYGRLCPISTPEGANIGLISHFALNTRVNELGFLEAPYKKVDNKKIKIDQTVYLTAEEEEKKLIAQYTLAVNKEGLITENSIIARDSKGEFHRTSPEKVDYIDVRSDMAFSAAASLIPFISNTEPGRATGGVNMQRQAVPLLTQQAPIVGTGQEKRIAKDSCVLIVAEEDGIVHYVDANKIIIKEHVPKEFEELLYEPPFKTYHLTRLQPTNQGIAIIHKPIVSKGQKINKGDFLCEGYTIKDGELALGQNLRVAIAAWGGFNFEDSIVVSERVVKEDLLTSIHIEEFSVDLFNTKLGSEEFTSDIPGVSEQALKILDENGIVKLGTEIKEGDILVGKITPQSNETPSPEAKLIAAIFGETASNVRDTSFRAPFACKGTVIGTKILYGQQVRQQKSKDIEKQITQLNKTFLQKLSHLWDITMKKLFTILRIEERKAPKHSDEAVKRLFNLLQRQKLHNITEKDDKKNMDHSSEITPEFLEEYFFSVFAKKKETGKKNLAQEPATNGSYKFVEEKNVNAKIQFLYEKFKKEYTQINIQYRREKKKIQTGHELPPGVLKRAKIYIAQKCKIEVGDKLSGRHGNKGVISRIVPEEDMPYLEDGTRMDIILNPLSSVSRMNLGQLFELLLGWAGDKLGHNYAVPIFEKPTIEQINKELAKAGLPAFGLTKLYDGLTGEPFEQLVTCGVIYILKLVHMVNKKIHARSTGPHALITQQPLGGRSRDGGQKFGEMDWWACSAHGVAYTTLEMYTTKSDDVRGRREALEAIYEGKNLPTPSVPESLKFLEQILYALSINLTFIS